MRLILTVLFLLVASTFFDSIIAADIPTHCWTCPSGWTHWWEMGLSNPTNGDVCQCMQGTPRSTTSAPNPTGYDTRGCWTCSPGYTHWFNAGRTSAPGGDACACVPITQTSAPSTPSTTTTRAPVTTTRAPTSAPTTTTTTRAPATTTSPTYNTRGCWTCSPGYTHWFNAGLVSAPGGDACACVPSKQTSAPSTPTTTTTRVPTSAPTTTTTTRAPVTTNSPTYDTRGCWTCNPGYTHWFNAGLSSAPGGDACACVPSTQTVAPTPTTTTRAPATTTTRAPVTTSSPTYDTRGCWTCNPGYTHWFNAGLVSAPGGDACACVPGTAQPTTSATTTKAPSSSPSTTTTTRSPVTTTRAPSTPISTPNCWACPTGWSHWYDFGYPASPSSDQCQCIQGVVNPKTKNTPRTPQMTKFINAMTPSSTSPGSVSFSPYVAPYAPWNAPPISLIDQLASGLYKQTGFRTTMIYYLEPYLAGSLVNAGFNILGIIALNTDTAQNTVKIQQAIDTVKKFPNNILALACGNELGMQLGTNGNSAGIINNCINTLRRANLGLPIGVTDTFVSWYQNNGVTQWNAVADNVDWIGVNYYAWFDNMYIPPPFTCETPENGPLITYQSILRVQALYPNIEVVLTEFGWPACPAGYSCTSPNIHDGSTCTSGSDSSQKTFVQRTVDLFRKYQRPLNTFAAYRESWKAQNSLAIEEFWGICSGTAPYSCYNAPV